MDARALGCAKSLRACPIANPTMVTEWNTTMVFVAGITEMAIGESNVRHRSRCERCVYSPKRFKPWRWPSRSWLEQRPSFSFTSVAPLPRTLAQVGQLGAADGTFAFDFDLVDARRMDGKNALHTFAVADAADGEGFVQAATAAADDHARENLDAFLVAFDNFGVHAHGVADVKFRGVFAKLFRFNFIK